MTSIRRIRASWAATVSAVMLCGIATVGTVGTASAATGNPGGADQTLAADTVSTADLAAAANAPEDDTPMAADPAMDLTAAQIAALPHSWNTPIGTFHDGKTSTNSRFCSGNVIYSPYGDVVLTAAHCVHGYVRNPGQLWFYPDYADGKPSAGRYGMWQAKKVIVPSQFRTSDLNSPYDYAFVVLKPYNGGTVAQRTGWLNPQINPSFRTAAQKRVTVTGYVNGNRGLTWCQSSGSATGTFTYRDGGSTYTGVHANCPNMGNGTSGGPFITYGTYNEIGLMGGYDRGGNHHPGDNYSPYFNHTFAAYWKQAEAY